MKRRNKTNSAEAPAQRSAPPGSTSSGVLSKLVLVASGMMLMFLSESLFWPGRGLAWQHESGAGTLKRAAALTTSMTNVPPWGRLEYVRIALDRPEDYFTNDFNHSPKTTWTIRNQSVQEAASFFGLLQLTDEAHAWLTDLERWQVAPGVIRITPPPKVVLSLSPETRQKVYQFLARFHENYPHTTPFRFRADGFDDWFAECGLPKEKIDLVRQLTYPQAGNLCFADAATFAELATPDETKCLIKSLWRVSTFMLKLRVDPSTDVKAMMNYWGALGSAHVYQPLVESMSRVPEGASINISYFLPPFARLRLYTYPNPRDRDIGRQDCFWSAMNFFNSTPDNRFFDPNYTLQVLKSDYARVNDGSRRYGDVLLLLGKNDLALHMCVYVADEVVFTKNGANTQQPWVLMKLPEMLGSYEAEKPFNVVTYRRTKPVPLAAVQELSSAATHL